MRGEIAVEMRRGVEWLHLRVRGVRGLIDRLNDLAACIEGRIDVAFALGAVASREDDARGDGRSCA